MQLPTKITVLELKKLAKEKKLTGYSKMKKQELVELLQNVTSRTPSPHRSPSPSPKETSLIVPGATYYPNMWNDKQCIQYKTALGKLTNWEYKTILMMGRQVKQGRKTAFFALDPTFEYRYSGTKTRGEQMPKWMFELKADIEKALGNKYTFNYCLCNWYGDGSESITMHSDDVRDLRGPIASVSFGAERLFKFANKITDEKVSIKLKDGSMVVMTKENQKFWKHGVPKQLKVKTARFNLTFRVVDTN